MEKSPIILIMLVLSFSTTIFALSNPAAVYCNEMNSEFGGYSYMVQNDVDSNEYGICTMPDGTQCDAWAFLNGECGGNFSYCANSGYAIATVSNGDSEYAACILPGGSGVPSQIPVVKMMNLTGKLGNSITPAAVEAQLSQMAGGMESESQPAQSSYNATDFSSWDWRAPPEGTAYAASNFPYFDDSMGWMTSIKDQLSCSSCWAFGTLGSMEAKYDIVMNESRLKPDLSEQDEVSCDNSCYYDYGGYWVCQGGCGGGWPNVSLWNIQYNGGVVDESCFPYTAGNDACSDACSDHSDRNWSITGFQSAMHVTDAGLEQMLVDNGPVILLVDARTWDSYSGGILGCTQYYSGMDHVVTLVGYNDTGNPSTSYWIIKNSWGANWGEEGYIRVKFDCDSIGYWTYYPESVTPPDFRPTIVVNAPTEDTVATDGPVSFNFTVNNRIFPASICDLIVNGAIANTTLANSGSDTVMCYQLPLGTRNNWSIRCWETGFGIVGSSQTQNLTTPFVLIRSPSNASYNAASIALDYTVASQDACWYSLDGNPNVILPGCGNTTLNSLSDGSHSIFVYENDTEGTAHHGDVSFTIDTAAPAVTLNSPADLFVSNSSTAAFAFTPTDNLAQTMGCSIFLDGILNQTNSSVANNTAARFTIQGMADGSHSWYVQCTDNANNMGTSATRSFTIDTAAPLVTLNSPANHSMSNSSTVAFNFTAINDQYGTMGCSIFLDGILNQTNSSVANNTAARFTIQGMADGSHSWYILCYDGANNKGTSETRDFMIALTPLLTSLSLNASGINNLTTDNLTCNYAMNSFATAAGVSWYRNGAPAMALYLPFEGNSSNALLDYSGNGINGMNSGAVWNSTAGHEGNGAFLFNGSARYVNLGSPASLNFTGFANFTITAWVNVAGGAGTNRPILCKGDHQYCLKPDTANMLELCVYDTAWRCAVSNAALSTGQWYFLVGRTNGSEVSLWVNGVKQSTTATHSGITADAYNVTIGRDDQNPTRLFNGTIDEIRVYNKTLSAAEIVALYQNKANLLVSDETSNRDVWQCRVTPFSSSAAGSTGISNSLVVGGPPAVTLNSPANLSLFNVSSVTFNFTAITNQYGTMNCSIFLDGALNRTNASTINNTATRFTIQGMADRSHSWYVQCRDGMNITGTSMARNFTTDTKAPGLSIISPLSSTYNVSTLLLNISASDPHLGRVWYNSGSGNVTYTNPVNLTFCDGSHTIYAWANDTFGNMNSTKVSFKIHTH